MEGQQFNGYDMNETGIPPRMILPAKSCATLEHILREGVEVLRCARGLLSSLASRLGMYASSATAGHPAPFVMPRVLSYSPNFQSTFCPTASLSVAYKEGRWKDSLTLVGQSVGSKLALYRGYRGLTLNRARTPYSCRTPSASK